MHAYELKYDVENFFYREAELLDERRFTEWLELLADDLTYFMPIRRNVKFGEHDARENTRAGIDISWFDEDKWTLAKRVDQILTGIHWAEEPLSRVSHLVTNVQIAAIRPDLAAVAEVDTKCRFILYQNRVESETAIFAGRRNDRLRMIDGQWKLARREILLDQNVLQAKNLSVFF